MLVVRRQTRDDTAQVRRVNMLACGQPLEANLVERLQQACPEHARSFVAEDDGIVGHILFTPVVLGGDGHQIVGMGLGPMAVLPERQREGIGSRLVQHGLAFLRRSDCPFVFVVGHPEYYPRFGFERASARGLRLAPPTPLPVTRGEGGWDGIPDEAVMVLILKSDVMAGVTGTVRYRPEFDEVV